MAYEVTLNSGIAIVVVPGDDGYAKLTVDELVIEFGAGRVQTSMPIGSNDVVHAVKVIDPPNMGAISPDASESVLGIKRTCIECQGRTYCISGRGACANTPCGWICA